MIKTLYPIFQHWSEKGSVYLIGDPHFGDEDCHIMNPDWIDPETQVDIINEIVRPADTLVILGDVGDFSYVEKLKVKNKILVCGNHDPGYTTCKPYFNEVYTGPVMIAKQIVLSHEPINCIPWAVNIHGHVHNGRVREDLWHINLAADVCKYVPVSLGELIKNGMLKCVTDIHRMTIDKAIQRKEEN